MSPRIWNEQKHVGQRPLENRIVHNKYCIYNKVTFQGFCLPVSVIAIPINMTQIILIQVLMKGRI